MPAARRRFARVYTAPDVPVTVDTCEVRRRDSAEFTVRGPDADVARHVDEYMRRWPAEAYGTRKLRETEDGPGRRVVVLMRFNNCN